MESLLDNFRETKDSGNKKLTFNIARPIFYNQQLPRNELVDILQYMIENYNDLIESQKGDEFSHVFWIYKDLFYTYSLECADNTILTDTQISLAYKTWTELLKKKANEYKIEILYFIKNSSPMIRKDIGSMDNIVKFMMWVGFHPQ